jgi:F-type H+-transporting ATPase subunit b
LNIQAYIFTVLAMVFIGSAVGGERGKRLATMSMIGRKKKRLRIQIRTRTLMVCSASVHQSTRQQEANKLLADAANTREQAAEARVAAAKASADFAGERERMLTEARDAAEIEKRNLLAQSAEDIAKLRQEAEAAIARERSAAEAAVVEHACTLAIEIAQRLLARIRRKDLSIIFIDEVCRELRALSSEARASLASAVTADHPIEIVSAVPLPDEEAQQIRAALREAFGRELPVAFRSDPAVISGIELIGRNVIIRNSWRADLDRIRLELGSDKHAPQS